MFAFYTERISAARVHNLHNLSITHLYVQGRSPHSCSIVEQAAPGRSATHMRVPSVAPAAASLPICAHKAYTHVCRASHEVLRRCNKVS